MPEDNSTEMERLIKEFRRLGVPVATCNQVGWNSDISLVDFILADRRRILEEVEAAVEDVRNQIVDEISRRPQYPNIDKKGCVTRINSIILPLIAKKKEGGE